MSVRTFPSLVVILAVVGPPACSGSSADDSTRADGGVWGSDSVSIEIWSRAAFGGGLQYMWHAPASELTDHERSMLAGLSTSKPSHTRAAACDMPWFDVYVMDRAGKRHAFIAIDPQCSAQGVLSYNAVASIASCGDSRLGLTPAEAPKAAAGRCAAVGASGAASGWNADLWAHISVPSGKTWVADVREPDGTNGAAGLRLHDSTATQLISQAAPGSSLDLPGPGEYVIDLHAVSERADVALALSVK